MSIVSDHEQAARLWLRQEQQRQHALMLADDAYCIDSNFNADLTEHWFGLALDKLQSVHGDKAKELIMYCHLNVILMDGLEKTRHENSN